MVYGKDRNIFKRHSGEEEEKIIKNSFQVSDLSTRTTNLPFPELGKIKREEPVTVRLWLHF